MQSISVILVQLAQYVNILLQHPQEHFRPVAFTLHYTCSMQQIIPGVGWSGEIPYVLVCQPVPGRFLSGVMAGTKMLLINFMKQCRNHVVIHQQVFAGYA